MRPVADYASILKVLNDAGVNVTDIMSTLTAHSDEAIYYRIDHHWTSLGGVAAELPLCRRTRPDGSHGPVHTDL